MEKQAEEATSKDQALRFLEDLEETLNTTLPASADLRAWIHSTVNGAKSHNEKKHLRSPEAAFLNGQVLPALFGMLTQLKGFSTEQVKQALLNEYHRSMPDISLRSPIRWVRHPFRKMLDESPGVVYQGWTNPEQAGALTQSCPDFSLRDPFPHSILFEGKYFARGSIEFAQKQLVKYIYEAFFYRGLPSLAATKMHPEWKYDYACLLVYDASSKGTLASAWKGLDPRTRCSFWEGANVYVMILRSAAQSHQE